MSAPTLQLIRVHLQRLDTQEYYSDGDVWTKDIQEAFDFEGVPQAIGISRRLQVENGQVVLHLAGYSPVTLPIGRWT